MLQTSDGSADNEKLRALESSFVNDADYASLTTQSECEAKLKSSPKLHQQFLIELSAYQESTASKASGNSLGSDAASASGH